MPGIFRLIRLRTLLFAVFTLYAMRCFVIRPILAVNDFSLQLDDLSFTLLVVAVCCLITGAYVIDDYFDTRTDRNHAIALHAVLNGMAVSIAFYLGTVVGIWKIAVLFVLVSGLLWFYSSVYKRFFLIGNLFVAFMTALIPLSALVFEMPLLNIKYADILIDTNTDFMYMFYWVGGFSCFLFVNTLLYEVNKDLYMVESDRENDIRTLPVKAGMTVARAVIALIAGVSIGCMWILYYTVFRGSEPVLIYFVGLSLCYLLYTGLILAKKRRRTGELTVIRLLAAGGIAFSLLLPHFFTSLF